MLQKSKLSKYLENNLAVWVPDMPEGVPPEEICIPHEHVLYRLIKGENATEEDLKTYYENDPNKEWGANQAESYAVSMYDDLARTNNLKKIASLKNSKAVAKIVLNPKDGVVNQTFHKNHYSWWKTDRFDINSIEIVQTL